MHSFIQANVPISKLTTFEIGGPARWLAVPSTIEELKESVLFAKENRVSIYPIGSGSNILASDSGYEGMLIKPSMEGIEFIDCGDSVLAKAYAGTEWDEFAEQTVSRNLAGAECMSGIPGKIGASPVQNIGAYGQEASGIIESIYALDTESLECTLIPASKCEFGYRNSRFKGIWAKKYIIIRVDFRLKKNGMPSIHHQGLISHFEKHPPKSSVPALQEVRKAVLEIRRSKSTLYSKDNPNHRCAGSFYVNPIIPKAQAQKLKEDYADIPVYTSEDPEKLKLSAAWLIQNSGFGKGYRYKNAGLSSSHVLSLINAEGKASAQEILELSEKIQKTVFRQFSVRLNPEPNMIGFV